MRNKQKNTSSYYKNKFIAVFFIILTVFPISAETKIEKINDDLEIWKLMEGVFVVIHKFPWAANSLIVNIDDEIVLVDTPYSPEVTNIVIDWINKKYGMKKIIEINTGFHVDNLGGNKALLDKCIPIYGSTKTVALLKERGDKTRELIMSWLIAPDKQRFYQEHASIPYLPPNNLFELSNGLILNIGKQTVHVIFPGETHTPDNVVVYFPHKKLLFGGCMILAGNKPGNTADANLVEWKSAVMSLKKLDYDYVIPGHGFRFDPDLIENTINVLP